MTTIYLWVLSHVTAGGLTSKFIPYGVGCIHLLGNGRELWYAVCSIWEVNINSV